MSNFQRVAVIGCPGSGKTTFSVRLGEIVGKEAVHLDKLLWLPNWQMMPYPARKELHDKLICRDEWLIDGMWRSHVADRVARATLVIFLDYPSRVCRRRAAWRHFKNLGKQRPDIAEGCVERHDKNFGNYVKNFRKEVRPFLLDLLARSGVETVVFTKPSQAEKYLKQLKTDFQF